jgi:hypothetical protein
MEKRSLCFAHGRSSLEEEFRIPILPGEGPVLLSLRAVT